MLVTPLEPPRWSPLRVGIYVEISGCQRAGVKGRRSQRRTASSNERVVSPFGGYDGRSPPLEIQNEMSAMSGLLQCHPVSLIAQRSRLIWSGMEEGGQNLVGAFGWIGAPDMGMVFVHADVLRRGPCAIERGVPQVLVGPDLLDGSNPACAGMSLAGNSNAWGISCGTAYCSDTLDILSH